jgi:hypothetical protein
MAERPWFPFYPSDWRGSVRLRSCSAGARALLVEMMCIMHDATPYGHLVIAGQPLLDTDEIAMHATMKARDVAKWMKELEGKRILKRTDQGVIYNARMVRDEEIRLERAKAGAKGGKQTARLLKQNPEQTPEQLPSTTSANFAQPHIPDARGQKEKRVHEHPRRNTEPASIAGLADVVVGRIAPPAVNE